MDVANIGCSGPDVEGTIQVRGGASVRGDHANYFCALAALMHISGSSQTGLGADCRGRLEPVRPADNCRPSGCRHAEWRSGHVGRKLPQLIISHSVCDNPSDLMARIAASGLPCGVYFFGAGPVGADSPRRGRANAGRGAHCTDTAGTAYRMSFASADGCARSSECDWITNSRLSAVRPHGICVGICGSAHGG